MRAADEAAAAERRMSSLAPPLPAPALSLREAAPIAEAVEPEPRADRPRPRAYHPRRHAPPRTQREKDFLARQGYIY
jgi:hypothetical protein